MEKIKEMLHHFFVPREENNFRAKSLHADFLTFYLLIALMMSAAFKQVGFINILGFATDITIGKLLELTNVERQKGNLPGLTLNDKLSVAARAKAADMFDKNYWAHYSPSGATPWDFINSSGYRYEFAGENLAKNFLFSDGVVTAWMNSATHRQNILKREYTEVGYAVVDGSLNGEPTTLVVQMFGRPSGQGPFDAGIARTVTAEEIPEDRAAASQPAGIAPAVSPAPPLGTVIGRNGGAVSGDDLTAKKGFLNMFNMNIVFFGFLLFSLVMDYYFASRMKVIRIGGKNLAHFLFIAFILAGLFISSRGKII